MIKYENRILCFVDILGFGSIVKDGILGANEIAELFLEIDLIVKEYKDHNIQITHFSDSIVISILRRATSSTQLKFIIEVLIKLLEYRLIARGAIVYGELVHTSDFIYGPALVKAAYLEKEEAKYPRIILDESLDENPLPTIGNASVNYRNFFNNFAFVKIDEWDNNYYIDLIGEISKKENSKEMFELLNKIIIDGLKFKNEKMLEKYRWLNEKMTCFQNP